MANLTVVATVLSQDVKSEMTHVDISDQFPEGPLTLESFTPLRKWINDDQLEQMYLGVSDLRRAFSSKVLTHFIFRRVNRDILPRADVMSEDAKARIESGGVLISLPTTANFQGLGVVGRPNAKSIDDAFKEALAQAVARLVRLASVLEQDDYKIFEGEYRLLGQRLEARRALFNINVSHRLLHKFPVRNWCEKHGTNLLASAYGFDETELEHALSGAFKSRLKRKQFGSVLSDEIAQVGTLLAWYDAHVERKRGEHGRRDSIGRILKKLGLTWQTAPGKIKPPRMNTSVRRKLVAQKTQAVLTTREMLEAAFLFDIEPAYSVFFTRLYMLPILASAGLAGQVALRGQAAEIWSPVMAGGIVALAESRSGGIHSLAGAPDNAAEDEIGAHQALVASMFERSGFVISDLADRACDFLQTERPVTIDPSGEPKRFFLDD